MILFLDFDGVLHPEDHGGEIFSCLPHLWEILRARPAVEVVFSTSWKEHHPLDELIGFATCNGGEDLAHRFLGCTPVIKPEDGRDDYRRREIECLAWLDSNQRPAHWLALDDIAYWFSFPCPNLYLVNYQTGLTAEDVAMIIARLK